MSTLGHTAQRLDSSLSSETVLCVDLDGTLVSTDTLWESFLALLRKNPLRLLFVPWWLLQGKAFLKRQIAQRVELDVSQLPYRREVLEFLRHQRQHGRTLVLTTAADRAIAERVAHHTGLFADVLASDGRVNLSGPAKVKLLMDRYGSRGFDYIGNGAIDVHVWRHARQAFLISPSTKLLSTVRSHTAVAHVFQSKTPNPLAILLRAFRIHQWIKNILLFIPLMLAHEFGQAALLGKAVAAFLAFSLSASAVYVLNDLLDLHADRAHPTKRFRPFAAGHLSIPTGLMLVMSLALGAAAVAIMFPPSTFLAYLALYVTIATAYSLYLKRLPVLDVIVLAALYTLRLLAGAAAVTLPLSPWLLAFSMFLFLSLAFIKRSSELSTLRAANLTLATGRGYRADDLECLRSLGTASGYISVLVLALYINSAKVTTLYNNPQVLWLICPLLLYWISRVWFLAHRGEVDTDPVVFALKDKVSCAIGLAIVLVAILAL